MPDVAVVAHGAGAADSVYVQGVAVNGRNLTRPFVRWADLNTAHTAEGAALLEFWMTAAPGDPWGAAA